MLDAVDARPFRLVLPECSERLSRLQCPFRCPASPRPGKVPAGLHPRSSRTVRVSASLGQKAPAPLPVLFECPITCSQTVSPPARPEAHCLHVTSPLAPRGLQALTGVPGPHPAGHRWAEAQSARDRGRGKHTFPPAPRRPRSLPPRGDGQHAARAAGISDADACTRGSALAQIISPEKGARTERPRWLGSPVCLLYPQETPGHISVPFNFPSSSEAQIRRAGPALAPTSRAGAPARTGAGV